MARRLPVYFITACLCLICSVSLAAGENPRQTGPCKIQDIVLQSFLQGDVIVVRADSPIYHWHDFFLEGPKRLAVDLYGCEYEGGLRPGKRAGRFISSLRVGRHQDKVRIVASISEDEENQVDIRAGEKVFAIYVHNPFVALIERIRAETKSDGSLDLTISTSKEYEFEPKILKLSKPNRLVFDLPRTFPLVDLPRNLPVEGAEGIGIRLGMHPGFTRIVFDLGTRPLPEFHLIPRESGLLVSLQLTRPAQEKILPATAATPSEAPVSGRDEGKELLLPREHLAEPAGIEGRELAAPERLEGKMTDLQVPEMGVEQTVEEETSKEPGAQEATEEPWGEFEEGSHFELHGELWDKFANDTEENNRFEDDRYNHAEVRLEAKYVLSPSFQAVISGEVDYFAYGNNSDWDYDDDIRLYNTYINWATSRWNLKVGNQIVKWGKTDQVSPLDNLNPEDLRDGLVRPREERKLPIPMVNLELYRSPFTLQGIFIPLFKKSELDLQGTDWAVFQHVDDKIGTFAVREEEPPNTLKNSEAGIRLSGTVRGLDYAFSYLYGREYTPSLNSLVLPPGFPPAPASSNLEDLAQFAQTTNQPIVLEHDRQSVFGFEFETTWRDFGIRGDLAYIYRRRFITSELTNIKRPVFQYVLGADYNGPKSFYVNFQFFQSMVHDYDEKTLFVEELTSGFNGKISKGFFDNNIEANLRYFYNITDKDSYLNPNLVFKYWDRFTVEIGADLLNGQRNKTIGWYGDNDQLYAILRVFF